ncbi:putative notoamide biosynthesis cluster protein O' [[Candida] jaroonii]|uniref:Notoamide biosynthesis cluster protein O n=1 Tax=[Candida] jaroonii TaxID=467808 RepID=A0ACA9YG61_9ASCO|nr:putative notoamide biosynthesis cluster protein O' [[Candida] jaroonii]
MMMKLHSFYRASYTQAIIIGILSFLTPGIFSAIQSLGAGGLKSPTTANAAYALNSGVLVLTAPLSAIAANRFGLKPTLIFGTLGYAIYSASLYENSRSGNQWFLLLGATCSGLSGGPFWTCEGAVAVSYPEEKSRGRFIATWQFLNKFGTIIAGAISLSLNINGSTGGSVSLNTYIVLFSLQCLSPFVCFLLSPPEKVIRSDGSKVETNITDQKTSERFKDLWRVFTIKQILFLSPGFLGAVWLGTWQGNYTASYFSVRARSLYSFVTAIICMITDFTMGWLLDLNHRRSKKVQISWFVIVAIMTGYYIFGFVMQSEFQRNDPGAMDWNDPGFLRAYVPFLFFRIGSEAIFNWVYYYMGSIPLSPSQVTIGVSIIRSCESLGQCLSYAVGAVDKNNLVNLGVSAAIFFSCVPSVTYATYLCNDEAPKVEDGRDGGECSIEIEKVDSKKSGVVYNINSVEKS